MSLTDKEIENLLLQLQKDRDENLKDRDDQFLVMDQIQMKRFAIRLNMRVPRMEEVPP